MTPNDGDMVLMAIVSKDKAEALRALSADFERIFIVKVFLIQFAFVRYGEGGKRSRAHPEKSRLHGDE
jgi:hypothetical protein